MPGVPAEGVERSVLRPIERFLRDHLDSRDLARLLALAGGDLHRLFLYDPVDKRVEPAEIDFTPEDLESVMRAADLLTSHADQLDLARLGHVPVPRREKFQFQYFFGPADRALYEAFMAALDRASARMDGVFVEENAGLDGPIVTVTIAAATENEYRQTKEHIEWLYEVAKKSITGEPYKGDRP